ncbi:hypothetical protein VNI00_017287 [Paramarasmius palmivorus]|uniref:Uncharacterized protein n=1 Tax=Paramarasmius palmivorus TaxID=297713 RepID=A0AAW0B9M9_9AGAR
MASLENAAVLVRALLSQLQDQIKLYEQGCLEITPNTLQLIQVILTEPSTTSFLPLTHFPLAHVTGTGAKVSEENVSTTSAVNTAQNDLTSQTVSAPDPSIQDLKCPRCGEQVLLPPDQLRWYAVTKGLRVGWVRGRDTARELCEGVPFAFYRWYPTEEAARNAFLAEYPSRTEILRPSDIEYPALGSGLGWLTP